MISVDLFPQHCVNDATLLTVSAASQARLLRGQTAECRRRNTVFCGAAGGLILGRGFPSQPADLVLAAGLMARRRARPAPTIQDWL
jgi:hypothetical protein